MILKLGKICLPILFALISFSAKAVTVEIVPNTAKEGDGKASIVKVNGSSTIGPSIVRKMIACHGAFNEDNQQTLLALLDVPTIAEMSSSLKTMEGRSHATGFLTTDDAPRFHDFVRDVLAPCLSH